MKRAFDFLASAVGLTLLGPVLLVASFAVFLQDFKSPFYIAPRVGEKKKVFKMIKLRSMIVNADKSGVDSTAADDVRITRIGHFIRRYKLDELTQLVNVLKGDMSLVGPRPNVIADTNLYTEAEDKLLSVKPGITDFSSIVFSDEGDILSGMEDADLAYNQLIRPWKSRLGLLYVHNRNVLLDVQLIFLTILCIIDKPRTLKLLCKSVKIVDMARINNWWRLRHGTSRYILSLRLVLVKLFLIADR